MYAPAKPQPTSQGSPYILPQNQDIQYAPQYGYDQPPVQLGYPMQGMQGGLMGQEHTQVIIIQVEDDNFPSRAYGRYPQKIRCVSCQRKGATAVSLQVGTGAWAVALVLCLFGFFPCMCVPCFVDDCKDAKHRCSNCGQPCGQKNFLFD